MSFGNALDHRLQTKALNHKGQVVYPIVPYAARINDMARLSLVYATTKLAWATG